MDIPAGIILDPPNLKPWKNVPVRQYVWEHFKVPTAFQNDANAAAWGEYRFGAGEQLPHVIVLTIGTGIGGGLIINGQLYRGGFGLAGEPGHVRVVPGGRSLVTTTTPWVESTAHGVILCLTIRDPSELTS